MTRRKIVTMLAGLALGAGCAGDEGDESDKSDKSDEQVSTDQLFEEQEMQTLGIACGVVSEHDYCSSGRFYNSVQYQCTHTSGETWIETRLYGGYSTVSCGNLNQ